jgi:subtilisin family serine protease
MTIDAETLTPKMLWHKQRINAELTEKDGRSPDNGVLVALIDTGVHAGHLFLEDCIAIDKAIDFVSHPTALLGPLIPQFDKHTADKSVKLQSDLLNTLQMSDERKAVVRTVLEEFNKSAGTNPIMALSDKFPSHGTACAGLIAARPPKTSTPQKRAANFILGGRYEGIAPGCKIVPIRTAITPDPEPIILALMYSLQLNVDVIHLPRGVSDWWLNQDAPPMPKVDADENKAAQKKKDAEEKFKASSPEYKFWKTNSDLAYALKALMIAVSKVIPIFCAAGNTAEGSLAYPSNLSNDDPIDAGPNGIISVGASTYRGFRSSYSNYGEGLTCVAPSDDAEVFCRHQIRLNRKSDQYKLHNYASYDKPPRSVRYSKEAVLTLDIPGSAGPLFDSADGLDEQNPATKWFDPLGSMFTLFGGTSAASAIAAGAGALIQAEAKARPNNPNKLSGIDLKQILINSCWPENQPTAHKPIDDEDGGRLDISLKLDKIDASSSAGDVADPGFEDLFGAGMIDVKKAKELVRAL